MNFLQNPMDFCKKLIFALVLISCVAMTVAGQTTPMQEQGKRYGDPNGGHWLECFCSSSRDVIRKAEGQA